MKDGGIGMAVRVGVDLPDASCFDTVGQFEPVTLGEIEIEDVILPACPAKAEDVGTWATLELVLAPSADHQIVTPTAEQLIVPFPTLNTIVALPRVENVMSTKAVKLIS